MKKLLFILLFIPFFGFSQGGTWPVKYNDSDPSGAPSAAGTRLHFNTATNTLWFWEPAPSSTWRKQPKAFDQVSGCAAPAYTPTARQSTFAVNSCTPPELYQYTGSAWECLNCVDGLTLTAGSGIALSGTAPDITISANDASATNELNTSLSVTSGNLRLTDAGGNLDVAVSSIAPVQAVAAGTGISISGTTTRTITNTAPDQTVAISAGTGIGVTGAYPNFTVTNTAPNVVQTLSIAGQDLTLSGGGGTVEIPGLSFPLLAPDGASPYSFAADPTSGLYTDRGMMVLVAPLDHSMTIQTRPSETGVPNSFQFNAGSGSVGTYGGGFILQSGNNEDDTAPGGGFLATAGNGTVGGTFELRAGNASAGSENGGFLSLYGGASVDAFGGSVSLVPGNGVDDGHIGRVFILGAGAVFPSFTIAQRNAIASPQVGLTLFCTDATATDSSAGVMQVWNGSVWKNVW